MNMHVSKTLPMAGKLGQVKSCGRSREWALGALDCVRPPAGVSLVGEQSPCGPEAKSNPEGTENSPSTRIVKLHD